jgi:hypothetical protein
VFTMCIGVRLTADPRLTGRDRRDARPSSDRSSYEM